MSKEGDQIIVIHAAASLKTLVKLGLNDSTKIKNLWLEVIKQVPFFSDNAVSTNFEISVEEDNVEATITITQKIQK